MSGTLTACELAFCGACHRNGQNQRVHVAMLGPLEVHADSGSLLEVGGARLRALLILLALQPGQVVTTGWSTASGTRRRRPGRPMRCRPWCHGYGVRCRRS